MGQSSSGMCYRVQHIRVYFERLLPVIAVRLLLLGGHPGPAILRDEAHPGAALRRGRGGAHVRRPRAAGQRRWQRRQRQAHWRNLPPPVIYGSILTHCL